MNKFKVYIVVSLLTFIKMTQIVSAQKSTDTVFYNLKQLLSIAQLNNRDFQLLRLELQKTDQQVALKKSQFLPKVDAFAGYFWYWGNVPVIIFPESEGKILSGGTSDGVYPVSAGLPNNLITGISLTQRIFDFSYLNAGKSREALSALETGKIKERKEQLYYDVATCYYEILQLAAKEDFLDFSISRINRMTDILKIQLKNQMTDSLQLFDLELKNAELEMSKRELLSGIQRKSNYLKMLTGLPDSIVIAYGTLDFTPVIEISPDSTVSVENTQMNILNQARILNDLSQKQARSEYLPTLDLQFNLLWNSQSQNMAFFSNQAYGNNISTLGLKLDIPIYHGSEKKIKMQEMEINRSMLDLQKQKLKEGIQLQYSNSREQLDFKIARYRHQQEITHLKKRYFEKANSQFEQGILSIKDLLEAQSGLLEAQMKLTEILFDAKMAELDYFKWSNQILTRFE
jgi:outer membrane protein